MNRTPSSSSTAGLVAISAAAAVGIPLTIIMLHCHKYQRWHSPQQKESRRRFRKCVAQQQPDLVGPDAQLTSIASTNRDSSKKMPLLKMLTSYHPAECCHSQEKQKKVTVVVLIHGFGCTGLEFQPLVAMLQKDSRFSGLDIFRYERILWADIPTDDCARDATALAQELWDLLQQRAANNNNKSHNYLLVGHSYGGLVAQYLAHSHPKAIMGMVLIDPAHEQQFQRFPRDFSFQFRVVVPQVLALYQRVAWTGFLQWLDRWNLFNFPPLFLLERGTSLRSTVVELYADGEVWKRVAAELVGCNETFDRMNSPLALEENSAETTTTTTTTVGEVFRKELYSHNIPVGLVIAGNRRYSPTLFPKAVTKAFLEMHKDMPSTKVFMAHQSDHWVHMSEPEIVVTAIHHVLSSSRLKIS